jgi:hypothetical protein
MFSEKLVECEMSRQLCCAVPMFSNYFCVFEEKAAVVLLCGTENVEWI